MARCILIVEDDPLLALHLQGFLEDAGFTVAGIANNTMTALAIARTNDLDAALMDIQLAGGDSGVETARQLRQNHDVPSLFVSVSITARIRTAAATWEPIGFLAKPFDEREIIAALNSALKAPE